MLQKKIYKSISLTFLFFRLSFISHSQSKPNSIIHIDGSDNWDGNFKAIVYHSKKSIKIIYKIKDSVSYRNREDSVIDKQWGRIINDSLLMADKKRLKDTVDLYMDLIENMYTYFSTDSLILDTKKYKKYNTQIKNIFNNYIDTVIQKDATIFLYSPRYEITVNYKNKYNSFFLEAPSAKRYSELYSFIMETFKVYKQLKKNTFLNKIRPLSRYFQSKGI
ncbi:MAG: hypothetical protein KA319_10040 [Ferruginibacter sp.]|nr:hypothetical protein [Ferruginibacter sp.]